MKKHLVLLVLLTTGLTISSFAQGFTAKAIPQGKLSSSDSTRIINTEANVISASLYGSGGLLGVVTGESSEKASARGSIGLNVFLKKFSSSIYFSYGNSDSTVLNNIEDFGRALSTITEGSSVSVSTNYYLSEKFGLSNFISVSDARWFIDEQTPIDASPFTFKLGGYIQPFIFPKSKNDIAILLRTSLVHRSIMGEFNKESRTIDNVTLQPKGYNGIEIDFEMYINSVQLFTSLSWYSSKEIDIPNFTGNQVQIGINIAGEVIDLIGS